MCHLSILESISIFRNGFTPVNTKRRESHPRRECETGGFNQIRQTDQNTFGSKSVSVLETPVETGEYNKKYHKKYYGSLYAPRNMKMFFLFPLCEKKNGFILVNRSPRLEKQDKKNGNIPYKSIPNTCSAQPAAPISAPASPREPFASEPTGEAPSRCQGVTDRLPPHRDNAAGESQSTLPGLPPLPKSPRPLAPKFAEETGVRGKLEGNPNPPRSSVLPVPVAGSDLEFCFPRGSLAAA